ncbi:MAG: hypothetical protein V4524_00430 [Patescibacteria group bacterium]
MKTITRILVALVFIMLTERAEAQINLIYIGGTPPTNSVGKGSLTNIVPYAVKVHTNSVRDFQPGTLYYGWTNIGGGQHTLLVQGGTPNRETVGILYFNNDNDPKHLSWFLDETPELNEEYTNYTEEVVTNLGGGTINATRCFRGPSDDTHIDLLTTAMHEVGHFRGLAAPNYSFIAESADGYIDITAPRPYAGAHIPLQFNNSGVTPHIAYVSDRTLMSGSFSPGERVFPSDLDTIAMAQLCGYTNVSLGLPGINLDIPITLKVDRLFKTTVTKANKKTTFNNAELSWTQPSMWQYRVELSPDLKNWSSVTNVPAVTNGTYYVTVSTTNSNSFFRLKKQ